jgi:hypothetical protein
MEQEEVELACGGEKLFLQQRRLAGLMRQPDSFWRQNL